MTMICFATYGDSAEFMTDTVNYNERASTLGHGTKHVTLNHLDAAFLTHGGLYFGDSAKAAALQASHQVATFDELVDSAQTWLRQVWTGALADGAPARPASVFLIGWSGRRERFAAYSLASEQDFAAVPVDEPFVTPTPFTMRPSDLELARFRDYMLECGDTEADFADMSRRWTSQPAPTRLTRFTEWEQLAMDIRQQRALEQFGRVIVAGRVVHTRLERGSVETQVIGEFDDSGEEFLQLVAFTRHPLGQVQPCWCDSGRRYLDCHLADELDDPCCRGKAFRDCCMIDAGLAKQLAASLSA
jgi:hypothetical protein